MRLDDDGEDDDDEDDHGDDEFVWRRRTNGQAVGSIDNPTGSMTGTATARNEGRKERRWRYNERAFDLATRNAVYLLRS